ncbi:MAG: hypothetical protein QME74_05065, partial [Candidatus Edwardsbacteria bacterium]|nr:hypothetical protein [Candidatus Edwardsbacteria bacterium]
MEMFKLLICFEGKLIKLFTIMFRHVVILLLLFGVFVSCNKNKPCQPKEVYTIKGPGGPCVIYGFIKGYNLASIVVPVRNSEITIYRSHDYEHSILRSPIISDEGEFVITDMPYDTIDLIF